jgi:hypothetical protein
MGGACVNTGCGCSGCCSHRVQGVLQGGKGLLACKRNAPAHTHTPSAATSPQLLPHQLTNTSLLWAPRPSRLSE